MPDNPLAVWSVFISGVLATVILLAGGAIAVVLLQRRYLNLHRSHARKILEAQEQERAWVSREVHDDAVQRVVLIGKECAAVADSAQAEGRPAQRLRAIQKELHDLSSFLRGLAHQLHPSLVDRGGLSGALAGLCEEMERGHGLRVEYRRPVDDVETQPGPRASILLFRIAQEALQNVVKHAGVPEASLELSTHNGTVELSVRDRGKGFAPSTQRRSAGMGLLGMRERAILAGGQIEVVSSPGTGTEVRARIPIRPEGAGSSGE